MGRPRPGSSVRSEVDGPAGSQAAYHPSRHRSREMNLGGASPVPVWRFSPSSAIAVQRRLTESRADVSCAAFWGYVQ
ncbi:protein of unknown function [Modestobacter italicus]|uniref:Uncharacterized protein n=1 Tax=Modestobacter italicus (strain DSM 44449 / CECT 9708 / BC 501) TaxID=2732864 RepID=I4EZ92_MODI5|nr:protein of unknown function [Modestobacter marinus]